MLIHTHTFGQLFLGYLPKQNLFDFGKTEFQTEENPHLGGISDEKFTQENGLNTLTQTEYTNKSSKSNLNPKQNSDEKITKESNAKGHTSQRK